MLIWLSSSSKQCKVFSDYWPVHILLSADDEFIWLASKMIFFLLLIRCVDNIMWRNWSRNCRGHFAKMTTKEWIFNTFYRPNACLMRLLIMAIDIHDVTLTNKASFFLLSLLLLLTIWPWKKAIFFSLSPARLHHIDTRLLTHWINHCVREIMRVWNDDDSIST